jgi:hypothetical protein
MLVFLLSVFFNADHCKRKCKSLYSDSPSRKSLCLGTCSGGYVEREKIRFGAPEMKKEVSVCLAKCNQNVNSTTDFHGWMKCRKTCVVPKTDRHEFFALTQCESECDRYWKGTVHWKPCQDQCQILGHRAEPGPTPPPRGVNIQDLW